MKAGIADAMKLALAEPDHERTLLAGAHEHARMVGGHGDERVVPAQLVVGEPGGFHQVAVQVLEIKWATTSASVSEVNSAPAARRRSRSSVQFSTIPLSTMWTRLLVSQCGCAFSSVTRPCVAQRVWPMPVEPRRFPFVRATASRAVEVADRMHAADVAVGDERQPRRVVAAVLEPLEPLEQQVAAFARPDVSDDPAHETP